MPTLQTHDVLTTLRMFHEENLDVRTVTMGINLLDCASRDVDALCESVYNKICSKAGRLVDVCEQMSTRYGVPIVNKRLAVSPASQLLEGHGTETAVKLAGALDRAAAEVGVDLLGGFTALVHKGMTPGERAVLESLPEALSTTSRVCASINVGTTKAGINVDAVQLVGQQILAVAAATADNHGFGAAKIVVFANIPEDNPFMAGAYLGVGESECVNNVGVSGPGAPGSRSPRH